MKLTLAKFDGDIVGEDVPADPRQHPQCVEVFEVPTEGGAPVRVFARPDGYVAPAPSPAHIAYRRVYWRVYWSVRSFLNRFARAWRAF